MKVEEIEKIKIKGLENKNTITLKMTKYNNIGRTDFLQKCGLLVDGFTKDNLRLNINKTKELV